MIANLQTLGAIVLGLVLAAMPYVMFGVGNGHQHGDGPHMDHAPRMGGQLGMVGDHHLELVQRDGRIFVYASDEVRVPVSLERGTLSFDDDEPIPMRQERFSLSAPNNPTAEDATCLVWLPDGTSLELTFGLETTPTAS